MIYSGIKIKVYVITYRRPHLLQRAIKSIIAQTHTNWIAEVINDDPADERVTSIINEVNDSRFYLSTPDLKRGGTANFNYAFANTAQPFATILEDDNWYEPDFLEVMLQALMDNNQVQLSVANEKIWVEGAGNVWSDTGKTIWPETAGSKLYTYQLKDKCGSAKICNSSMLWRTDYAGQWLTPGDIPIDVTEHFRERVIPHPILLVNKPLVNFAQTLQTSRSTKKSVWGEYQTLLITSIFEVLTPKEANRLADDLWFEARANLPQYKTSLLHSGLSNTHTFILFKKATFYELFRYCLTWLRHPVNSYNIINAPKKHKKHFDFLINSQKQKDVLTARQEISNEI
jgi:glycosyltransferase involved in cell wall biosynthesis